MKNPYRHRICFGDLIPPALIKAAPALAEPASPNVQTYVSYVKTADLDLASEGGQRTLDRRVAQAAREVCGTPSDVRPRRAEQGSRMPRGGSRACRYRA